MNHVSNFQVRQAIAGNTEENLAVLDKGAWFNRPIALLKKEIIYIEVYDDYQYAVLSSSEVGCVW